MLLCVESWCSSPVPAVNFDVGAIHCLCLLGGLVTLILRGFALQGISVFRLFYVAVGNRKQMDPYV